MKDLVLGVWLGIQACIDFKYKEISIWHCFVAGVIGIGICVFEKRGVESIFLSLIPGVLFMIFSKITKEVVGYGDGIVLLVMAFYLTLQQQVEVIMIAFLIAGIVALILLTFFRKNKNDRMPLIPFFFFAFLVKCSAGMERLWS